jgi:sensor histidine kinase YesM
MIERFELKISILDWFYIVFIGAFFGLFISIFLYFINESLHTIDTIYFGVFVSISISIFASLLISISNNHILPNFDKKFWYPISFFFSFCSGAIGFLFSYLLFYGLHVAVISLIEPFYIHITITAGLLTFLIGLILHKFISMKYKNESYKTDILQTKIKSLENELNPHFLFNALNSVSELIHIDPNLAEKSVLNLSKFLRNAINTDTIITLEEELQMVRTYVDIENIRFNNLITLQTNSCKNFNSIMVPKFSIQLLVENGIKHGYCGKELQISINCQEDKIEVCNNGQTTENIEYGTGLSNLSKRLELLDIGTLNYSLHDDKVCFEIGLER